MLECFLAICVHITIRLEAMLQEGEYWIYSTGQFGSVHVFGYDFVESEPIPIKSGAL